MSFAYNAIRWCQRPFIAFAGSPVGGWFYRYLTPPIDRILVPLSRGRLSMAIKMPVLILTSIGAKSGQPRTTPLLYLANDTSIILAASNGGSPRYPGWYHNLRANPQASVQLNGQLIHCTAREASEAEYDALWNVMVQMYPGFAKYRE